MATVTVIFGGLTVILIVGMVNEVVQAIRTGQR